MMRTSKWCINDCDATARCRSSAGRLATNAPMSAKDMIQAGRKVRIGPGPTAARKTTRSECTGIGGTRGTKTKHTAAAQA